MGSTLKILGLLDKSGKSRLGHLFGTLGIQARTSSGAVNLAQVRFHHSSQSFRICCPYPFHQLGIFYRHFHV